MVEREAYKMKQAMRKDFFREIKKSMNRFLSILLIVALGVAFFSGIRATSPDMKLSADQYYDKGNMMDFRVVGTWGLTKEDLDGISSIEGVKEVEPIYSYDVMGKVEQNQYALKLYSKPEQVNKMTVLEGRMPNKEGECAIDSLLLSNEEFQIGKTITISSGDEDDIHDIFKNTEYKIVGVVSSPIYMDVERGSTTLGDGKLNGYIAVTEENFTMEVYTEAYVTIDGAKEVTAYSKEYDGIVEPVIEQVESFMKGREKLRYDDTILTAKEEIAKAEKKVRDGEKQLQDGKREVKKAKQKLKEARQDLIDGEEEISLGASALEEAKQQVLSGENQIDEAKEEIERSEETLDSGKQQLEDGKQQVQNGEIEIAKAKEQIQSGKEQIQRAKQELQTAKKAYQENKEKVESKLKTAKEQLDQTNVVLKEKEAAYTKKEEEALLRIEQAKEQIVAAKAQLAALKEQIEKLEETDSSSEQLIALKENYQKQQAAIQAKETEVAKQEEQIMSQLKEAKAQLTAAKKQYEAGLTAYKQQQKTVDTQLVTAKQQLVEAKEEITKQEAILKQSEAKIKEEEQTLTVGKQQLAQKEAEWNRGKTKIEEAKDTLVKKEQELLEAKETISNKEVDLEEGKSKLQDGKKEIAKGEKEVKKAEKKIKDSEEELEEGKQQLADAKEELANLEEPEYYVLDRDTIVSAVSYENDADRIKAIGRVFPVIFFLVAALVSLTTMTRMVENDRTQIGTLKALGYGKVSIAMRYILYALLATVLGSLLGVVIGQTVFPYIIITTYRMMYQTMTEVVYPIHSYYSLTASFVAIVTILAATLFACVKELQEVPAGLMRPVAPKVGKRVLLEKIPFIWNHLGFTGKVTIRNLFRYKKRFFMTVFGIGGCMALIIVGFGIQDSIQAIAKKQYGQIMNYDLAVSMKEGKNPSNVLKGQTNIKDSLNTYQRTVTLGKDGEDKTYDSYLVVPEKAEQLHSYIALQNRMTKEVYQISSNGVIVSEKLQKLFNLQLGDTITLEADGEEKTAVVEGFTENYLYHYVYMSKELYKSLYEKTPDWNQIFIQTNGENNEQVQQVAKQLLKKSGVSSVTNLYEIKGSTSRMIEGMEIVIIVLIVSAGALAFVVLYNLNNINISERKRELATIKVLGFYNLETAEYVYRENIILTVIGILLGGVLGFFLHRYVIVTAELDMMMMGREVRAVSYLYAGLLTIVFAMFVNFVLYFKLKKIDMVESLKSVE